MIKKSELTQEQKDDVSKYIDRNLSGVPQSIILRANPDIEENRLAPSFEEEPEFPMWGTMWLIKDSILEDKIRAYPEKVAEFGFTIYDLPEEGILLGINGAGYDFYEAHWFPLMQWDMSEESTPEEYKKEEEKTSPEVEEWEERWHKGGIMSPNLDYGILKKGLRKQAMYTLYVDYEGGKFTSNWTDPDSGNIKGPSGDIEKIKEYASKNDMKISMTDEAKSRASSLNKHAKQYDLSMPAGKGWFIVKDLETGQEQKFNSRQEVIEFFQHQPNANMQFVNQVLNRIVPGQTPMSIEAKKIMANRRFEKTAIEADTMTLYVDPETKEMYMESVSTGTMFRLGKYDVEQVPDNLVKITDIDLSKFYKKSKVSYQGKKVDELVVSGNDLML